MGTLTFQAALGGSVNLLGPNTASNINFTLPSADGTSGQPLQTNGSGTLSFANLAIANGGTGATSFTANQIHYGSFSQSAGLTFDGTNFATTGTATATKLIPTGTSVTGNGMYLPATNALGFSTNGTNAVYIDASQNVGIGTSSPATGPKLTVQGGGTNGYGGIRLLSDNNFSNGANYVAYGRRSDGNSSGGFAPGVLLARVNSAPAALTSGINLGRLAFGGSYDGTDANVVYGAQIAGYSSGTYSSTSAATDIVFFTTPSGTAGGTTTGTADFGTERMRIDSSGNLLVGGTTVRDSAKITCETISNGLSVYVVPNTSAVDFAVFRANAGTLCGAISRVGTTAAVVYTATSDYRLKENVAPMTDALAKIAALKPVTFTWKDGGAAADGFIAHEFAEVCPNGVTGEKDGVDVDGNPKYQAMDSSAAISILVAAIQEQQALITTLTARIEALEAK